MVRLSTFRQWAGLIHQHEVCPEGLWVFQLQQKFPQILSASSPHWQSLSRFSILPTVQRSIGWVLALPSLPQQRNVQHCLSLNSPAVLSGSSELWEYNFLFDIHDAHLIFFLFEHLPRLPVNDIASGSRVNEYTLQLYPSEFIGFRLLVSGLWRVDCHPWNRSLSILLNFQPLSADLAISRAFWSVSVPLASSNFLRRLCDQHLSIIWSRLCSSLASPNSQFSDSWNNLSTNWNAVSDSSCFAWRNWCLSKGMLTWCAKCASSVLTAFAYRSWILGPGTGPGSVRVSKISCTSCPAQWRSSVFLWESFLTPLASRKNSKERFQRHHDSWTNASWVAFAVERTDASSKFNVYCHFRYFSSRRLLTIDFTHTCSNNNKTYLIICCGQPSRHYNCNYLFGITLIYSLWVCT